MASDLLVEGALDPEELAAASAAADTYIDAVFHGATPLPAGFEAMREEPAKEAPGKYGGHLALAWAFDPALEALAMHPRLWSIVLELTGGKPHLSGGGTRVGTMIVDDREVTVEGDPLDPDHKSRQRGGGAGCASCELCPYCREKGPSSVTETHHPLTIASSKDFKFGWATLGRRGLAGGPIGI